MTGSRTLKHRCCHLLPVPFVYKYVYVCVCASVRACVFTDHLTVLAGVAVLDLAQRGRDLKVLNDEDF